MEVEKEEPLELWEVKELLEKRRGDKKQFEITEQRRVYEYATEAVKLSEEDAKELLNTLTKKFKIPKIIAVQLTDVLPLTLEELEPFLPQLEEHFTFENVEERREFEKKLLDELRKYQDKARTLISSEEEESEEGG